MPEDIARQSSAIAKKLGVEQGRVKALWFGIDWIQDKEGKAYFLEANRRPDVTALRDHLGGMDKMGEMEAIALLVRQTIQNLGHAFP